MSDEAPQKAQQITPVPVLRFTSEPVQGHAVRLTEDEGTLGRSEDNDYVVSAPTVSRVHARFTTEGAAVVVTDLGSSGGTKVNDETVEGSRVVRHGDRVTFGQTVATFEDPASVVDEVDETTVFEAPEISTGPEFSPRQQQVIEGIAEGMTNKEIGEKLGISERTVKAYAQEIYSKLEVSNRAQAVAEAINHGLLIPGETS